MAVLYASDRGHWWAPQEAFCFFCGGNIADAGPTMYWVGSKGTEAALALHPTCAEKLGCHLIADAREALLASGAHPWPHRAARALRSALRTAEGADRA